MLVDLDVQRVSASKSIPGDEQFQHWAETVLADKGSAFSLSIRVVDEEEAQRLNLEYRGKDYATNVLSFSAELPEGLPQELKQSQLGDLLICSAVVKREAAEQQRAEVDHWAHLVVHGVLHLLGHDHEDPSEAELMESLEVEILASMGISNPYQEIA